jgi:hypothetical protein
MKKSIILLVTSLILNSLSYSQTKQIAHKSHSGSTENFNSDAYNDNFGLYEPYFPVEKVVLTKKKCLVEIRSNKKADTICDHPYLSGQYTLQEIKTFYGENVEFKGFENKFFNDSIPNKKPQTNKNSLYLIAFLIFSGSISFILFRKSV